MGASPSTQAATSDGHRLYSSAEARISVPSLPPATSTRPSARSVAVWPRCAVAIHTLGLKVPVFGWYSSAGARSCPSPFPATSTRPSARNVAVWPSRALAIEPVGLKRRLFGSYSSAEALGPSGLHPPATRTRPSARRLEVWYWRGAAIEPVGLKVPLSGSYSSAEARGPVELKPPATARPTLPGGAQLCPGKHKGESECPQSRTRPSSAGS